VGRPMRIAYFYLTRDQPDRVRAVAPDRAMHWRDLRVPGYVGGPLGDSSGGLITFEAESPQDDDELVANDPFVRAELLERSWIKEWNTDVGEPVVRDLRPMDSGPDNR
jgi:uncharacterized protein YciI